MAKLVVTSGDLDQEEFPMGSEVLIGRSADCDVRIPTPFVSRQHARITQTDGRYFIQDLETSNGTFVNGREVQKAELGDGDRIGVGDCELTFKAEEVPTQRPCDLPLDKSAATVISTVDVGMLPETLVGAADTDQAAKLKHHLRVLQEVAETSCGSLDIGGLVEKILDELLRVYPQADHAHAVLLGFAEPEGDLHLSAARKGLDRPGTGVSRTLLDIATRDRKALLASDVNADARFSAAQSIVGEGLRSMMCSPVVMNAKVMGAIQVDTTSAGQPFTNDDLQLLATVSGQAAVAAENVRLHREVVAQQRLAAIGQTISSLAHCIKNVINGLQGGAYILDLGLKKQEAEKIGKGWEMVKRNNDFMFDLVKDMLAYCRKSPPRREPLDIGGLLQETVLMVEESASQKGIEMSLALSAQLPKPNADPTGMKRVVLNLLTNAIEACAEGCSVGLLASIDESKKALRISVEDDGPGMAEDVKKRLFEPFFTTKGSRGTGLGLALVKKVMEEHHGSVEVESEPGRGTAFHLFLPVVNEEAHGE